MDCTNTHNICCILLLIRGQHFGLTLETLIQLIEEDVTLLNRRQLPAVQMEGENIIFQGFLIQTFDYLSMCINYSWNVCGRFLSTTDH